MKKLFLLATLLAMATGCDDKEPGVSDLSLDVNEATLSPIETLRIEATVTPEGARVEWTSSNTLVATVENGVVTPLEGADGQTVITAKVGDRTATCTVNVDLIGTASFRTDRTWTVGDQTWSDTVMATGAKKDSFDGGYYVGANDYEWKADCRQNEGYGDLFSYAAVRQFRHVLCPDPWRVPVKEDFWALDKALGGPGEETGTMAYIDQTVHAKYMNPDRWGGQYGGFAYDGTVVNAGANGYYATQTEIVVEGIVSSYSYVLFLRGDSKHTRPAGNEQKFNGQQVRCVK